MTRLAVTTLQAFAAIGIAVCGAVSFFTVPALMLSVTLCDCALMHFHEGRFRLFGIESTARPLVGELIGGETNIRAYSRCADWPPAPPERVNVDITAQQSTRP